MTTDRFPDQPEPVRLTHLTPIDARRVLGSNPRLLVPVGTMIARGPHLPLGCDAFILERLADDVSAALGIPRAPVIPFGVHSNRDPEAPGSAALTRKTLHRLMNELIADWETEAKVEDVFILTTHAAEAHLEALSTIRSIGRVTLIDIFAAPVPDELASVALDTALLMWLAPSLVDRAMMPRSLAKDAEHGERLYHAILSATIGQVQAVIGRS